MGNGYAGENPIVSSDCAAKVPTGSSPRKELMQVNDHRATATTQPVLKHMGHAVPHNGHSPPVGQVVGQCARSDSSRSNTTGAKARARYSLGLHLYLIHI